MASSDRNKWDDNYDKIASTYDANYNKHSHGHHTLEEWHAYHSGQLTLCQFLQDMAPLGNTQRAESVHEHKRSHHVFHIDRLKKRKRHLGDEAWKTTTEPHLISHYPEDFDGKGKHVASTE